MFTDLKNVLGQNAITDNERLTQFDDLTTIISVLINFFIAVGFSLSMIGIAYAFIQFIMSKGDPKVQKVARDALTFSIVAMLISLLIVGIKVAVFSAAGVVSGNIIGNDPGF